MKTIEEMDELRSVDIKNIQLRKTQLKKLGRLIAGFPDILFTDHYFYKKKSRLRHYIYSRKIDNIEDLDFAIRNAKDCLLQLIYNIATTTKKV